MFARLWQLGSRRSERAGEGHAAPLFYPRVTILHAQGTAVLLASSMGGDMVPWVAAGGHPLPAPYLSGRAGLALRGWAWRGVRQAAAVAHGAARRRRRSPSRGRRVGGISALFISVKTTPLALGFSASFFCGTPVLPAVRLCLHRGLSSTHGAAGMNRAAGACCAACVALRDRCGVAAADAGSAARQTLARANGSGCVWRENIAYSGLCL